PEETYADLPVAREAGVRAWVTVMRGCDRFCTFCIVPYVRGRERSLPGPVLLEQVRALAADGVREVVFLGQTVNAYHDGAWDFAELVRRSAGVPGIVRIRFTSPHPSEMGERLIDAMAECDAVAPQLHLPVQSGSDRVLARMQRDYHVAEYEALVARLRARVPGIALSTDGIVGFPGEDEADFAAPAALLRRLRCARGARPRAGGVGDLSHALRHARRVLAGWPSGRSSSCWPQRSPRARPPSPPFAPGTSRAAASCASSMATRSTSGSARGSNAFA